MEETKRGRPAHTASAYNVTEARELTLLDRFLTLPRFQHAQFRVATREEVVAAVLGYVLTGSLKKASQISGVDYENVKKWRTEAPWWDECVECARSIISEKLEDKFTSILNEALNQLGQRLETGDIIYREGRTVKVPIKANELAKIVQVLFDKRQLIRGDVTSRSETTSVESRLENIKKAAEEFAKRPNSAS